MNKYTRSQFVYSTYGKPVMIAGTMVLAVPVQASLVNQGVTITSDVLGSAGNSITYAVTGGGTAGSEVVTVSGNAISIQIQSGVSTVTQVRTALNASTEAAALITASGTSGSAVTAPVAATALSGGVDGVSSSNFGSLVASAVRTGVGTFLITFSDQYNSIQSANCQFGSPTAQAIVPQISDFLSGNGGFQISLLSGSTPTDVTDVSLLYFNAILNASSI